MNNLKENYVTTEDICCQANIALQQCLLFSDCVWKYAKHSLGTIFETRRTIHMQPIFSIFSPNLEAIFLGGCEAT